MKETLDDLGPIELSAGSFEEMEDGGKHSLEHKKLKSSRKKLSETDKSTVRSSIQSRAKQLRLASEPSA